LDDLQAGFDADNLEKNFEKARTRYQAALEKDRTFINHLAPTLLNQSVELEQERNRIPEMEKKLSEANNAAIAGDHNRAVGLYKEAIRIAPNALKELDPETQYKNLAPKGPGQGNNIVEMQKLLEQANNAARAGHAESAISLYQEAKKQAPDVLKDLDPQMEYSKLAPKPPGQQNANPPVNPSPAPTRSG
jgi:tetratricopeptide (TPR) repeat protein